MIAFEFLSSDKTYAGLLDHEKLFRTKIGRSLKCKSENLLLMSSKLQVKLVPMQMQAFSLPRGQYGKGDSSEWLKELQKPESRLKCVHFLLKNQFQIFSWLVKKGLINSNLNFPLYLMSQRWSVGLTTTSGWFPSSSGPSWCVSLSSPWWPFCSSETAAERDTTASELERWPESSSQHMLHSHTSTTCFT